MQLSDSEFKEIFPFDIPRKNQREIINKILTAFYDNKKKYVVFCGPTGTGKSVIGYSIAKYIQKHSKFYDGTFILTSQKCLQQQYYTELKIPYIMGRSNYLCAENSELTCELGACKGDPNNRCDKCPYITIRDSVFNSPIANMNYSYFLTTNSVLTTIDEENNIKTGIPHKSFLILDECHNCENELSNLGTVKISNKSLQYLGIQLKVPDIDESEYNKFNWLFTSINDKLLQQKIYFKNQINNYKKFKITKEYKNTLTKFSSIERLIKNIQEIKLQYKNKLPVIINSSKDFIEFKLLYVNTYFNQYINTAADKLLFMSATVLNKIEFCRSLGLNPNDVEYISQDSIFPIENRVIHYTPVGSLSYKNKFNTLPKMVERVKLILQKYPLSKGIIHTVNYNIAEVLMDGLYGTPEGRRLLNPQGKEREAILNSFKESDFPYVLISPSLTEGLDLKDDLSRFCIICKMPFASLGDKWVETRKNLNQIWYINKACETLVQMTGRSIRSELDYCDTFILDSDFLKLAHMGMDIFPKWWKDAVIDK